MKEIKLFFHPLVDLIEFVKGRQDISRTLSIMSFPVGYLLFKDSLVFNEELLIVLCFMSAIYFLYVQLGDSIEESLNERSAKIKKDLVSFDVIKLDHLNNLYKTTSNVLQIKNQIHELQKFSIESIDALDENQRQAFVGLISKNIVDKLQILTNVNKTVSSNFLIESFTVKFSSQLLAQTEKQKGKFFAPAAVASKKSSKKKRSDRKGSGNK